MKQTQNTHACSLAREEVAYSLAREKAAAVIRESREVAACSLAREERQRSCSDQEKTPKALLSRSNCLHRPR